MCRLGQFWFIMASSFPKSPGMKLRKGRYLVTDINISKVLNVLWDMVKSIGGKWRESGTLLNCSQHSSMVLPKYIAQLY